MSPFRIQHNAFHGSELELNTDDISEADICQLISQEQSQGKQLLWLTLRIEQSALVPLFIDQGFVFHLCDEQSLTLIHRLKTDAFAPFAPTHTAGVGGLVFNDNGEVLLIRDRWMNGKGFKLPGGYIDLGEPVQAAAEREVFEETGIHSQFEGIVSLIDKHPHAYGRANFYIVCRMQPTSSDIHIYDVDEIELAQWVDSVWFINDDDSSHFHRHLVKTLSNAPCLANNGFDFQDLRSKKVLYSGKQSTGKQ